MKIIFEGTPEQIIDEMKEYIVRWGFELSEDKPEINHNPPPFLDLNEAIEEGKNDIR